MQTSIKNLHKTISLIGYPDLQDSIGGIAIWGHNALKYGKYKFVRRVEMIGEQVPGSFPMSHVSNMYVWIRIPLTQSQISRIIPLSSNFLYDKGKKMLIIRSCSIDRAIALATVIKLYAIGKLTLNQIMTHDLFSLRHSHFLLKPPNITIIRIHKSLTINDASVDDFFSIN